jgi:hypothetical protein
MHRTVLFLAVLAVTAASTIAAQQGPAHERLDLAALQRIREEGLQRSRIDTLATQLLDGIGPRLTGSPGLRQAQDWAVRTLGGWGLANVVAEPWDTVFGRGWERVAFAGRMLEPFVQPLHAQPLAWSGSTRGTITCPVVAVEVRDTSDFARYEGRLRGACVMRTPPPAIAPEWSAAASRLDADSILAWAAAPASGRALTPEWQRRMEEFRRRRALDQRVVPWLVAQQPAAILSSSSWTFGMLRPQSGPQQAAVRAGTLTDPLPALMIAHEQYGTLWRNVAQGVASRLELDVQNRLTNPDGREYNVLADIPGTDLARELVLIGAHLDSWHGGTGATDNAAGVLVMMEAMRILKALDLPMRRTVRIGLWAGEEQGTLGSDRYVRMHAAELPRLSVYLNKDAGTGRVRGINTQGNMAAVPIFEQLFAPLRDLGVVAAIPRIEGSTDIEGFDGAGVPGFELLADDIDYFTRTWHSDVDTYERLLLDDLRQSAVVVAWTVYALANRDELLPRQPRPPLPSN